ncbi:hypothetical protein BGW37DRAFT_472330 [Umbelopsis sp. PMI_123]|nr:hypothetical protein BGW37DRAFT_472330 [Umbelopsis sp. PMI_123]
MRSFSTVTLFAAAAFVGSQIQSVMAGSGQIVQVVDSSDFCFFLPPPGSSDMNISDNEGDAVAYCMGNTPKAVGANTFPSGFILSAHFVSTSDYVQVTGQIDPSKANLVPTDQGGQYDVVSPPGASCAGYQYFVNLVEPAGDDYCIRCCNTETNCNRGISQDGCARVVPGDYSGPGVGSSSDSTSTTATTTTAAPAVTTTTADAANPTTTSDSTATTTADGSNSSPAVDAAGSSGIPTNVVAAPSSSILPSTSLTLVSASSSAAAIATTNLPSGNVSAQSVNSAATAVSPITITALALGGGMVALMQFI